MFVNELFDADDNPFMQDDEVTYIDELSSIPHKYNHIIKRLARFHNVKVDYDEKNKRWFATNTHGLHPFIEDAKHMVSAAHYGHSHNVAEDIGTHGQLIAMFFTPNLKHKIHVFATKDPNVFEIEDDAKEKTFKVHCSFNDIRRMMPAKGFSSMFAVDESVIGEATGNSIPSKKESVTNKGMDKMVAKLQAWQDARDEAIKYHDPVPPRPSFDVAVIVRDYPDMLAYGILNMVGRSGLLHVKLNGGKLPGWAAGDTIAVRPNEVYAAWDPILQDKQVVHREYDNTGKRIART